MIWIFTLTQKKSNQWAFIELSCCKCYAFDMYVQAKYVRNQKKHWLIKSILMSSALTLYSLSTVCLYLCSALFINEMQHYNNSDKTFVLKVNKKQTNKQKLWKLFQTFPFVILRKYKLQSKCSWFFLWKMLINEEIMYISRTIK